MSATETSIEAYNSLVHSGEEKNRCEQVFKSLGDIGGSGTQGEIYAHMVANGEGNTTGNPNTIARLNDLKKEGRVKIVGTKVCTVNGTRCQEWQVINGPKLAVPSKKETHAQQLAAKDAIIVQYSAKVVELKQRINELEYKLEQAGIPL